MANNNLGAYDSIYQQYANMLQNNGYKEAIESARQNMIESTNRQYDNNAKNYYKQYRINESALPEKLSRLGVTGGASETAQLKLMNGYSGNLYDNETARANALNNGNMEYDRLLANNSINVANQLADVYLNLAQQARNEQLASSGGGGYGGYGGYGSGNNGLYIDGLESGNGGGSGSAHGGGGGGGRSFGADSTVNNGAGSVAGNAQNAVNAYGNSYATYYSGLSGAKTLKALEQALHALVNRTNGSITPEQYRYLYNNVYLPRRKYLAGATSTSGGSTGGSSNYGAGGGGTNYQTMT